MKNLKGDGYMELSVMIENLINIYKTYGEMNVFYSYDDFLYEPVGVKVVRQYNENDKNGKYEVHIQNTW